jgi:hypothetical protein
MLTKAVEAEELVGGRAPLKGTCRTTTSKSTRTRSHAWLTLSRAATDELASLYVDPSHENRGIGRKQFSSPRTRLIKPASQN